MQQPAVSSYITITAITIRGQCRNLLTALVAMLVVTLVMGVTACAPIGTSRSPATARVATVLRIWYGTDDPTERAWSQDLARRFAAEHPSVHVRLTDYSLDDLNTKMQLALNAGTPPDLVYTTPRGPGLPAYVRADLLRDLTSVARAGGWAGRLRPGLLAEYNRLLATGTRTGRDALHTPVYAVPYDLAAVAVLYNKALFRKLGLQKPHTVAALERMIARVKSAGLVPLGLGNADGWLGDDWWSSLVNARVGPAALAPELRLDRSFSFCAPVFRWAAETLQRWADAGDFTPNFGGLDAQDGIAAFFQGRTAMQLVSSTQNSQILAAVRQTGLEVGIFPFPSVMPGQPPVMLMSGYEGWAIPKASRQPHVAAQFIDYALSPQTARLLLAHGMLPAHRLEGATMRPVAPFQRDYFSALAVAAPGVYLDGAPVPNLNATMEANIQLLLQDDETPDFLIRSLQLVYTSHGAQASSTRTDGEF